MVAYSHFRVTSTRKTPPSLGSVFWLFVDCRTDIMEILIGYKFPLKNNLTGFTDLNVPSSDLFRQLNVNVTNTIFMGEIYIVDITKCQLGQENLLRKNIYLISFLNLVEI